MGGVIRRYLGGFLSSIVWYKLRLHNLGGMIACGRSFVPMHEVDKIICICF